MSGLFLSLIAGFTWSLGNIIDKFAASRFIKSPIFLTAISASFALGIGAVTIVFVAMAPQWVDWSWFALSGGLYIVATWLYFLAIQREEPSRVIPLFALTIVFLTLQSALFLGEIFPLVTYLGIGLITAASFALMARHHPLDAFRSRSFGFMVGGTFMYSLSYVINKHLLEQYSYWEVFGYHKLWVGLIGLVFVLCFMPELRRTFTSIQKRYLGLSFASETCNGVGSLLFLAASAVWFVALVETVVSVQYVFLFIWGLLIARFWPRFSIEAVNRRTIIQKIFSISAIILGIYLIT